MDRYLYVKSFEWNDEPSSKMFRGEPKKNRVYYAEDFGSKYRIILDPTKSYAGISIKKENLSSSGEAWDCDMEIVSIHNLLDLDLSSKDLKMMADEQLRDEKHVLPKKEEPLTLVGNLGNVLYKLRVHDNDAYEAVVKLTTVLADSMLGTGSHIDLMSNLEKSPLSARIANVAVTVSEIDSYLNHKNPLDMSHLLNAARQLFIEIIRMHKLNKNV